MSRRNGTEALQWGWRKCVEWSGTMSRRNGTEALQWGWRKCVELSGTMSRRNGTEALQWRWRKCVELSGTMSRRSGQNSYSVRELDNPTLHSLLLPCRPVRENQRLGRWHGFWVWAYEFPRWSHHLGCIERMWVHMSGIKRFSTVVNSLEGDGLCQAFLP